MYDGEVGTAFDVLTLLGMPAFIMVVVLTSLRAVFLGLYDQATKRAWWMPWRQEAMKDVVACDKLRGVGKLTLIRRFPNGETHCFDSIYI